MPAVGVIRRFALPGVALGSVIAGAILFVRDVRLAGELDWDQGAHALHGLLIAADVRSGDGLALLLDTYKQVYWPFLHSWLSGAAFLVAPAGNVTARTVSLLCFVALAPMVFMAARASCPARPESMDGDVAGLIAGVLTLTSPALLVYATAVMLEIPALLGLVSTLYARFALRRDSIRPPAHVVLGVAVIVTYFLKSNYGILVLLVLAADALIEARFRLRSLLTAEHAYALAPVVVAGAIWFAYPPKVATTWAMLVNVPLGATSIWSAEGLLYYPHALLHQSGSPLVYALLLGATAAAWRLRRTPSVRVLLLLVGLHFLIVELHHTKVERYVFPMLPAMFILAGVVTSGAVRRRTLVAASVATVLLVTQARSIATQVAARALAAPAGPALEAIASSVRAGTPALIVSTTGAELGPPTIDWYLATRANLLHPAHSGAINEVIDVVHERRVAAAAARWPLSAGVVRALARYEEPGVTRSLVFGRPGMATADAAAGRIEFDRALTDGGFASVVAITPEDGSGPYPLPFLLPSLARAGFRSTETRRLDGVGVRVDVFRPG